MRLHEVLFSRVSVCVRSVYLQRLEEAEGAQSPAAGHQAEGGVVEHLLVVVPAHRDTRVR